MSNEHGQQDTAGGTDSISGVTTRGRPSFAQVPRWLAEDGQVSSNAVKVYAILTRWADLPDGAYPALATVAERLGASKDTARRAVRELRERGALEVVPQRDGKVQRSNLYVLHYADPRGNGATPPPGNGATTPLATVPPPSSQPCHPSKTHGRDTHGSENNPPSAAATGTAVEELPRHRKAPEDVWPAAVVDLTREFAKLVRANGHPLPGPGTKRADGWYDAMEKLLRLGPPGANGEADLVPSPDEVRRVMRWALAESDFWPANIRAAPKLREQFTRLRGQAGRRPGGPQGPKLAQGYAEAAERLRSRGQG